MALTRRQARAWHQRAGLSTARCRATASIGLLVAAITASAAFVAAPRSGCLGVATRRGRVPAVGRRTLNIEGAQVEGGLEPLANYVLVRPREASTTTKSGLLLSAAAAEKPNEGEVVAVGPGAVDEASGLLQPVWAEVGANVVYSKYGVDKVKVGDVEHILVKDSEVLLSYKGDEATLDNVKMPRGKVLIQLQEKDAQTKGGILLSKGSIKADTTLGNVVVVGEGVLGRDGAVQPVDIAVGDHVRFKYGNEVKLDVGKDEYRVVDAEDCIAKWSA